MTDKFVVHAEHCNANEFNLGCELCRADLERMLDYGRTNVDSGKYVVLVLSDRVMK